MLTLAFFSARFSFSVLPAFLDWCWRGDLSAIWFSFRWLSGELAMLVSGRDHLGIGETDRHRSS